MGNISEMRVILLGFVCLLVHVWQPVSCEVINIGSVGQWDRIIQRSSNGTLAVAQFSVEWCPYCQTMKPQFERMSLEDRDVIFLSVDVEQQRMLAWRYGVQYVPTYKYFKHGRNIDSITSWNPRAIKDLITRHKNSD